jgi:hypothetical protein
LGPVWPWKKQDDLLILSIGKKSVCGGIFGVGKLGRFAIFLNFLNNFFISKKYLNDYFKSFIIEEL